MYCWESSGEALRIGLHYEKVSIYIGRGNVLMKNNFLVKFWRGDIKLWISYWIFGVLLIHSIGMDSFNFLWLQLKLLFVVILTIYHFFLFQCLRKFAENNNSFSPKFYRIINEIPTILLIGIILVVVFKPL